MQTEKLKVEAIARGFPDSGVLLWCDVARQQLMVLDGASPAGYRISTSARGLGQMNGSYQTPAGWHEIRERIGAGAEAGTVFKARVPTGAVLPPSAWSSGEGDAITSRILRLHGLEPGHNQGGVVDTYARFVYIHGTNHETDLGRPASRGCVRMANRDVIHLFDRIGDRPAWCWIG